MLPIYLPFDAGGLETSRNLSTLGDPAINVPSTLNMERPSKHPDQIIIAIAQFFCK